MRPKWSSQKRFESSVELLVQKLQWLVDESTETALNFGNFGSLPMKKLWKCSFAWLSKAQRMYEIHYIIRWFWIFSEFLNSAGKFKLKLQKCQESAGFPEYKVIINNSYIFYALVKIGLFFLVLYSRWGLQPFVGLWSCGIVFPLLHHWFVSGSRIWSPWTTSRFTVEQKERMSKP